MMARFGVCRWTKKCGGLGQLSMVDHAVHWAEGLFLQPHHFQAADRRLREEITLSESWFEGYAYGLRKIEIDDEALANWRIVLRACHCRFQDGTHVRIPEDANLNAIDLPKTIFDRQDRVMIYIGISRLRLGRKNAAIANGENVNCRYLVETVEVEDENDPGNPQSLSVRWPNVKLLVGDQELAGYEVLPVMRLRRGAMAESVPEIDRDYIPPILACDAWKFLQEEILSGIYNQVGTSAERLAAQIVDRGIAFESGHREDLEHIFELHSLNSTLGWLANLPFVRGIHPLTAYMELCRAVGMLSIFRPERRMPEVPRYDHDDLGMCFHTIWRIFRDRPTGPEPIIKRPFIGAGLQLQVRLEREWLTPGWIFFIGVDSKLGYDQVVSLLDGQLNMKVGSTREVDAIFARGRSGVGLIPEKDAPRALPGKTWAYWKVNRDSSSWKDADETLTLGVRINDRQIEGRIEGEQTIRVRIDNGQEAALSFALFAVPASITQ
jgi:type VI secretion system protein ImpJ